MRLSKFYKYLLLSVLLISAFYLRFANLGYSDFQGDEIKALLLPDSGQTISDFLLTQRKGPMQFFVTYILGIFDPSYRNQFLSPILGPKPII